MQKFIILPIIVQVGIKKTALSLSLSSTIRVLHQQQQLQQRRSIIVFVNNQRVIVATTNRYQQQYQQQQQQHLYSSIESQYPVSDTFSSTTMSTSTLKVEENNDSLPKDSIVLPQLPLRYNIGTTGSDGTSIDLISSINKEIHDKEEKRKHAMDASRTLTNTLLQIRNNIGTDIAQTLLVSIQSNPLYTPYLYPQISTDSNSNEDDEKKDSDRPVTISRDDTTGTTDVTTSSSSNIKIQYIHREGNWEYRIEEYIRLLAYQHFLTTGTILTKEMIPFLVRDEEYIIGVCIGLCNDLSTSYSIGRATVRDVTSVQLATTVVQSINGYLLQHFDYRNGPIRRKYDSIKYCVKDLETILYELSITDNNNSNNYNGPDTKRHKSDTVTSSTPIVVDKNNKNEFYYIVERMKYKDEVRENLIKKCRDGQKIAKSIIYTLHRFDIVNACKLIDTCYDIIINQLLPLVQKDISLRSCGSFTSVLEEYIEAYLFTIWLYGKDYNNYNNTVNIGTLLSIDELRLLFTTKTTTTTTTSNDDSNNNNDSNNAFTIEIDEYLGGLCDLTGEIGRYAVVCGTKRDVTSVQQCLITNTNILNTMQSIQESTTKLPNNIYKKVDTVRKSITKLHRMLYEISLSNATGGHRTIQSYVSLLSSDQNQNQQQSDNIADDQE